jgi:hypothetical protein
MQVKDSAVFEWYDFETDPGYLMVLEEFKRDSRLKKEEMRK